MATPIYADIEVRVDNSETNKAAANSWAEAADLEAKINFRMDAGLWDDVTEATQVRAIVSAYKDLEKLSWSTASASQDRIQDFDVGLNDAPIGDEDFDRLIVEAQVAQIMFILAGTQARDLAAQGITLTRALTGVETEIQGYRGAVCTEALELLGEFINLQPRIKRMGR